MQREDTRPLAFPFLTEQQKKQQYPTLTKDLNEKIFGLNAAKLFKVDVEAKQKDVPKDYLSHIKMAYLEEGSSPATTLMGGLRTCPSFEM
ncbi:MAG: hypothetical protein OEM58_00680 [Nitrospirota bacterium]|nr:hypothetical protein [Nitrospirota bacterium]